MKRRAMFTLVLIINLVVSLVIPPLQAQTSGQIGSQNIVPGSGIGLTRSRSRYRNIAARHGSVRLSSAAWRTCNYSRNASESRT